MLFSIFQHHLSVIQHMWIERLLTIISKYNFYFLQHCVIYALNSRTYSLTECDISETYLLSTGAQVEINMEVNLQACVTIMNTATFLLSLQYISAIHTNTHTQSKNLNINHTHIHKNCWPLCMNPSSWLFIHSMDETLSTLSVIQAVSTSPLGCFSCSTVEDCLFIHH